MSDSAIPWPVGAYRAPPSVGFSRQEYWSGLPFPSPEDLPDPGIEPGLQRCRQTLYRLSHQGSLKKSYDKSTQRIKKQRHRFADKVCIVIAMPFLVVMYGCERWIIKKADAFQLWCWRRLESPLDSKEIKSVNLKGNQL